MAGTWEGFARRTLAVGGWPDHLNNFVSLVGWEAGEGTKAKYNPFATTRPAEGATDFNSSHVKDYVSWEQGVAATVATINNGNYPEVIACLRTHKAAFYTLDAVRNSKWGTFHVADGEPPFDIAAHVDGIRERWATYAFKVVAS
jgi:hypothetical protein